jgi:hypothetical protein
LFWQCFNESLIKHKIYFRHHVKYDLVGISTSNICHTWAKEILVPNKQNQSLLERFHNQINHRLPSKHEKLTSHKGLLGQKLKKEQQQTAASTKA